MTTLRITIDRHSQLPIYRQLVQQIQERIQSGTLAAGARLPAIRQMAEELGLTRLTVHNAYEELQAEGWIESWVGRGSFVTMNAPRTAMPAPTRVPIDLPASGPSVLANVLRLAQQPGVISLAQAYPAPETFPVRELNRAVQQVLARDGAEIYDYGPTQGELCLREQLSACLIERGVAADPEHLVVVSGAQQGIDLVLQALVAPGEYVLVEAPTYLGLIERMETRGTRLIGVSTDQQGLCIDALEAAIEQHRPRLLYTVPTYHNPTGRCLAAERRRALLALAERHQLLILEDDVYGLLSYDGEAPPALKAEDRSGLVIYLTSLSKVLMPGLRLGVLLAASPILEALIAAKRVADLHSPGLLQRACAEYLARDQMHQHLRATRRLYRERRDYLDREMKRALPATATWSVPSGGLCLWLQLPPGLRSMDLYPQAIERGVAFAPGEVFFPGPPTSGYLRISWAAHDQQTLHTATGVLGELLHEYEARRTRLEARSLGAGRAMV